MFAGDKNRQRRGGRWLLLSGSTTRSSERSVTPPEMIQNSLCWRRRPSPISERRLVSRSTGHAIADQRKLIGFKLRDETRSCERPWFDYGVVWVVIRRNTPTDQLSDAQGQFIREDRRQMWLLQQSRCRQHCVARTPAVRWQSGTLLSFHHHRSAERQRTRRGQIHDDVNCTVHFPHEQSQKWNEVMKSKIRSKFMF